MVKRLFLLLMCAGLLAVGCKMETDNGNVSAPSGNGQPDSGDKIILHSPLGYVYISGTGNPDIDYEILAMSSAGDGWYQYIIEASSAEIFFLIADDNWENISPVFYVTEGEWWYDRATGEMVDTKPELNDDAGGSGDISFLPAPEEVTATYSEQDGSIFLFWTPVPGAISYEIFYNTINAFENADSLDDLADYYTYITGAEAGVTYYFWIKAKNGTVVSDFSTYAQCRVPQKETLAAPTGVRATAISTDTVQVFWNPAEGASSYRIYYSTSNNTAYAQYTTAGGSSVYVSGLNSGTGYYFWVKSVGTSEISDFSLVSYAVTQEEEIIDLVAPTVYQWVAKYALSDDVKGIKIKVSPYATIDTRIEKFRLYRSETQYGNYECLYEIPASNPELVFEDRTINLISGKTYYYRISGVCKNTEVFSKNGVKFDIREPIVKVICKNKLGANVSGPYYVSFNSNPDLEYYDLVFSPNTRSYTLEDFTAGMYPIYTRKKTASEWTQYSQKNFKLLYSYELNILTGSITENKQIDQSNPPITYFNFQ